AEPAEARVAIGSDGDARSGRALKLNWYVLFGANVAACVLYRVVLSLVGAPLTAPVAGARATLRIACYAAAGVALLTAMLWTRARLELPEEVLAGTGDAPALPDPRAFMT